MLFKRTLTNNVLFFAVLITVLLISVKLGFTQDLHPMGLNTLHEIIPGMDKAPQLFTKDTRLPSSVDLSSKFPPVGDQGQLGSCAAFAVGYAAKTYQEKIDWAWNVNVNHHIFSPSYIYNQIHSTDEPDGGGANLGQAFDLLKSQGCTTLSDMPYSGDIYAWKVQPTSKQRANASNFRSNTWCKLPSGNFNEIKANIVAGKPVVISIPVYPDFDKLNNEGYDDIYDNISGVSRGNHALCVVGYNDSKAALKFINSWGVDWGVRGYGWISYNLISSLKTDAYTMSDINNSYSYNHAKGDFNGDGKTDLIFYMPYDLYYGSLRFIYLSTGDGKFMNRIGTQDKIDYTGYKLVVGDYNGDSKDDIMWYSPNNNTRFVYLSNGNGTFMSRIGTQDKIDYTGYNFAVGDYNGDGADDFMWYSQNPNTRFVYLSNGNGTFMSRIGTQEKIDYTQYNFTTGDFDGDGNGDFIWYKSSPNMRFVYLGNGDGTFRSRIFSQDSENY